MRRFNLIEKRYTELNNHSCFLCLMSKIPIILCLFLLSCGNPLQPVDVEEEERVKSELQDRSFRQFAPSKDALKRKGVILDFFDNDKQIINLWAQYAEGDTALNEWEIIAMDYRVEKGGSEYRLYFEAANSHQNLPNTCENCIETEGISISVRNLFDNDKIEFRINDQNEILPLPFPIFNTWTKFREDEYFD